MAGAVSAANDDNSTALGSDLDDNTITQHLDTVEDNASEKSISDDNRLISENELEMEADATDNVLKGSETVTVNNWGQLKSAVNDGAVIELSGDDVYYAEESGITIDLGTVTIDGKGHTIDAQGLNSHIFVIGEDATLNLKNLILKNALNNGDGGAIYSSGTLTVTHCTFTNNTAAPEKGGGAIYNHEGTLKILNSRFEKNSKYDRAIYNYAGDEDNLFRLTIINTTMIEDKVCVNFNDNERRLDDKRDIDLLTTEVNAYIQEILYDRTPVLISVTGVDADFTGSVTVNITNTIYNTVVSVANGEGNTTLDLDINRYTARFKNFISLTEDAFERDDTKPYLEINFKVASKNSFSALDEMISKSTGNVTLNQDYFYDSKTDSAYIRIVDRTISIDGNGHSINGKGNNGDTLFLIEDDSNVIMENITLENGRAQSRSHLGSQIRMGGAIFVSRSNLTLINSTLKNNKADGGSGGAIYSEFSTLKIIGSNFTNNNAENGKNIYVQGGNGVYILNTLIDNKDIYNEPDWDNNEELARITILNDLNATIYISDHLLGDETSFVITQPENITSVAGLTINNNPKGNIQFTNCQASADLNLKVGSYIATITTPDIVYYTDPARNLTCTYLSATTASNEFTVVPRTYIVNNSNVDEIFNGTNGTLSDFIGECDILDFNGTIDRNRNLIINRPVNIISSEENAVINLHTVIGDYEDGIPKFSFVINEGASGSNISNLYINNTQTWIYHVDGLYLENIIISVRSANGLGAEKGHTAIRFCNNIVLDNCSIFTENTGESCLVVYVTSNFTFVNSIIEGQGKIGPVITLQCPNEVYDMPYEDYVLACANNTIKNSIIKTGYPDADPIKSENADHTTIDGVKVYASKNVNPGQYATVMNSNFYNASGIVLSSCSKAYNNTVDGSSSDLQNGAIVYNNTFKDVKISNPNVVFVRNTVTNKLTIISPSNIDNNTISSMELKSGSKYSNITNNIIGSTVTVDDVNVTVKFNTITTTNKYAVVVNKKGAVITNNKLYAESKFGDDAVDRFQDTTVVEDNTPKPSYKLLQWIIDGATGNMALGQDYYFNDAFDGAFDGVIISKDLTIIGNGYTIDGMEMARIFQITNGANVVIENVTFINGKAQKEEFNGIEHDVGGAITVKLHSNLTLINCTFTNAHADQNGWGGAIFITGNSTLSIMASDFTDSYAQEAGNVLYALDGNYVDILECNVDGINLCDIDIDDMGDSIGNDKGEMGLLAPIKIFMTPNLMANISDCVEGENAQIRISEPSNFSGMANLNIGNKTVFNIQFNEGVASVQLDLTPGKAYAAIITNDYAEYGKNIILNIAKLYVPTTTATNSFKVMKKPNIQFDVQNITYNQIQTIKATVNGTGNVTIKLNGVTIVDNRFINKTVNCTIGNLNVGIYSIELNYSGDEFTIPGIAVFNFTVNKINSALSASSVITVYNGGKYLAVTLKDDVEKPIGGVDVKIKLNGIIYTKTTDKNGNVKLSTDALAPKTYLAIISFAGNAEYVKSTKTVNVKVTKATPKLAASKKSFIKSTKTKKYAVTLKTNQNKAMKNTQVILKVNKKTYKVKTNSQGKATFKITNLKKKGKYSAKVVYSGDKCYNGVSVNVKITVK